MRRSFWFRERVSRGREATAQSANCNQLKVPGAESERKEWEEAPGHDGSEHH